MTGKTGVGCVEAFHRTWMTKLNTGAKAVFGHGALPAHWTNYSVNADGIVESLGYTGIGFNWELLDAGADPSAPRSALGQIEQALLHALDNPSKPWLDPELAASCASDFVNLFDPAARTIVSNRYDGLWNPIAGAPVEWGFVGYDEELALVLLLIGE